MKCQRCCWSEDATYRVHSDVIDMKVCAACAGEARGLGITVELLNAGAGKGDAGKRVGTSRLPVGTLALLPVTTAINSSPIEPHQEMQMKRNSDTWHRCRVSHRAGRRRERYLT